MDTHRHITRTPAGSSAPIVFAAIAAVIVVLTCSHLHTPVWLGMGRSARLLIAGMAIFIAVFAEMTVLRQKKLILGGVATHAIVDEIRPITWANGRCAVYYHYFTEDRRVISACCARESSETAGWGVDHRLPLLYDRARPARHAIGNRLWAIRWDAPSDGPTDLTDASNSASPSPTSTGPTSHLPRAA
jgi:hypothetical protein